MVAYIIGMRMPGWSQQPRDGGIFTFDATGPSLILALDDPTPFENIAFRKGEIKVGILEAGIHTAFFIFEIAGIMEWSDGSYALGLVHPALRNIPPRTPDLGWFCNMFLVNRRNGILCAMRAATFPPNLSGTIDMVVENQAKHLPEFTREKHLEEIALAHKRWPNVSDMISDALVIERIGLPFPKQNDPSQS